MGAGASTATWHIGKELVAMGHEIVVLTSSYKKKSGYDCKKGMKIFRCPCIRKKKSESNIFEMLSFVISAFFFLPWIIIQHQIKGTIVFFSFPCGPLGLWVNFLFGIPYIISLRGGDVPGTERSLDRIHKILQPLRRLIFRKSRAVIANSQGLKRLAQKADPVITQVIHNGIDTSYFRPRKNHIEKGLFSFIFVGRFSEQKNLFFLIEQFSMLKKKNNLPFIINMVGEGPLKGELQQFAKSFGIADRIMWYGWLTKSEVLKLLQKSNCFINPSFYEGMPNAVLEAQACGLPVIVSNVAGNNTVVIDGQDGFLFDLGDSQKFKNNVNEIMGNADLRGKLGDSARKKMIKKFHWRNTAMAYADFFI